MRLNNENFRQSEINQLFFPKKINQVTTEQMTAVGREFVKELFTSAAKTAVVCHPDKATEVANEFNQLGLHVGVTTSIEDSVLGQSDK